MNFHLCEKTILLTSARLKSAQISTKMLEIHSSTHFGHMIPYGDFNFLNTFGPKCSPLEIATFHENRKIDAWVGHVQGRGVNVGGDPGTPPGVPPIIPDRFSTVLEPKTGPWRPALAKNRFGPPLNGDSWT